MKFVEITLLFSILGLSSCSPNPQFSWLRVQPQPLLKVTFPDGQEDIAVLKRYNPIPVGPNEREEDVDQCIFDGYLSDEKEVYVTVTGCPLSGKFDVLMRSSRLSHSMFSVAEGVARQVPSIFGSFAPNRENVMIKFTDKYIEDEQQSDSSMEEQSQQSINKRPHHGFKQQPHHGMKQLPQHNISSDAVNPKGYVIPMKIRYDENFARKFGADAVNTIRRIAAHSQSMWKWPSLKTSLTFKIDANIEKIPGQYAAETDISKVAALSTDPKFYAYVYWAYRNNEPGAIGMGYMATTCSRNVKYRTSLNEYVNNDLLAAQVMSHELGHNMGMDHDFDDNDKGRTDSKGNACTGIGSIMDYSENVDKWSTCSNEDITSYINRQTPFCLTAL